MNSDNFDLADDAMARWNRAFTSRHGDGSGDPEEQYHALLNVIAYCKPKASYLDIGCGFGRIIEIFKPAAGRIIGLEPSPGRFEACYNKYNDGRRIRIINSTSSAYKEARPKDRFDIIVVSMVLQHVATAVCDQILRDVHDLLAAGGVAIIATTHLRTERFMFPTQREAQTVEQFDEYAANPENQRWGIPVRMFSQDSLRRAIEGAGLHVIDWSQFSYARPERQAWLAGEFGLQPNDLDNVGFSQYAVVNLADDRGRKASLLKRLIYKIMLGLRMA